MPTDFSTLTDDELIQRTQELRRQAQAPGSPAGISSSLTPSTPTTTLPFSGLSSPSPGSLDIHTGAPSTERLIASFFNTPEGKLKVLTQKFGKDNARIKDGEPQFLSPSTGRWTLLDEDDISAKDALDIMADIPGILAGMGGTAVGSAIAGVPGGIIGSGIANVGSEGLKRAAQFLFIGDTEDFQPLDEFALGAIAEGVGQGVTGTLKSISKKLKTPIKKGVAKAVKLAEEKGLDLTMGQRFGFAEKVAKQESFIERFPFADETSGKIQKGIERFGKIAEEDLLSTVGKKRTSLEVGQAIDKAFKARRSFFRKQGADVYGELFKSIPPDDKIGPVILLAKFKQIEKEMVENAAGDPQIREAFNAITDSVSSDGGFGLERLKEVRSSLLEVSRKLKSVAPSRAKRWSAQLNQAIDMDINNWGRKFGREFVDGLNTASAWYRKERGDIFGTLTTPLLAKLDAGTLAAEDIIGPLLKKGRAGRISAPQQLKKALGKETFEEIQGFLAWDFLSQAEKLGTGNEGVIMPGNLRRVINNFGDDALIAVFETKEKVEALKNLSLLGSLFVSPGGKVVGDNPSGTAQALIKAQSLAKAAAVGFGGGQVAGVGGVPGAMATTLGPIVYSKILQSKSAVKILSRGEITPATLKALDVIIRNIVISTQNRRKKELEKKAPSPSLKGL